MVDMLKALSEENRLEIVKILSTGPLCVCEIEEKLKLSQNLTSHHLSVLKKAGIVEDCRCGKKHYYSLDSETLMKVANALTSLSKKPSTSTTVCRKKGRK